MSKGVLEQLKALERGQRSEFFQQNKEEILALADLDAVNGGVLHDGGSLENPGSMEVPFQGNWISSYGYVCDGREIC